jgi:hypothetical protein
MICSQNPPLFYTLLSHYMEVPLTAKEKRALSQNIDKVIKKESAKKLSDDSMKVLVLGTGDSGKTTLLRQMRIIYGDKYSEADRKEFRKSVLELVKRNAEALAEHLMENHQEPEGAVSRFH